MTESVAERYKTAAALTEEARKELCKLILEITKTEDAKNNPAMISSLAELFNQVNRF
ncbi:hypothetical protein AB6860_02970 [Carnobacterium divergens]|uniref:hypothetical protein n=1 Tax=Carnobacterium divergens TaxID=2748 RepID=UPI0039C95DE3